jgi:hypothetical protein
MSLQRGRNTRSRVHADLLALLANFTANPAMPVLARVAATFLGTQTAPARTYPTWISE